MQIPSAACFIVPAGGAAAALGPLPIEALRLPPETVELLHSLGIWRIGQLEALPREELSSRFGPRLAQRWDQATGRLSEPLRAYGPPPRFLADWSPEYPAARREMIEAAVERLVGRLAAMLGRCGRGGLRLQCRLSIPRSGAAGVRRRPVRADGLGRKICSPWSSCNWSGCGWPGRCGRCHVEATITAPLGVPAAGIVSRRALRWQPAAAGRAGRAAQQPAGAAGRGAGAAAAGGPAGTGLPLRSAGADAAAAAGARAAATVAARVAAAAVAVVDRGRGRWRSRRSCPTARRCDCNSPAGSSRSRTAGGRSGSRPAGGAAGRWAAIIIASKPPPAAAFGSFAACATANGSCTGRLIEAGRGRK